MTSGSQTPAHNFRSIPAAATRAAVVVSEHRMSLPLVVSASVALVLAEAVRRIRAHQRDEAARRISGGRKALVLNLLER